MSAPGHSDHLAAFRHVGDTGVRIPIGPFLVRLRSDVPGVANYVRHLYADFAVDGMNGERDGAHFDIAIVATRGVRRWWRPQANLTINDARPFLPLPANLGGALFEWGMNWCVGNRALTWVAVHAAVVERHGRALIMSAESGAGKSTLCAALTFGGWRLFSDEFALVDPREGTIRPMPRPISLKDGSIEVIRARAPHAIFGPEGIDIEDQRFTHVRPPVESVTRANEPAPPGCVLFPRYAAGRPTRLERVPKAQALVRLVDQSFNYNNVGAAGYLAVADLVRRSDCFELEYSDLDDVIGRLDELVLH